MVRVLAGVLLMLVLVPRAPVAAQAIGLPVQADGIARGVAVRASVAFPNDAAFGGGTAVLAGLSLGGRRAGASAFLSGTWDREDDGQLRGGGAAGTLRIFGGPLVPFAVLLHGGVGYGSLDDDSALDLTVWHVPVALALTWTFPRPVVAVKPWIAPRLDWTRVSLGTLEHDSTDPALSAGIVFGFLNGLGIEVSYDRVLTGSGSPTTVGVGLRYQLR